MGNRLDSLLLGSLLFLFSFLALLPLASATSIDVSGALPTFPGETVTHSFYYRSLVNGSAYYLGSVVNPSNPYTFSIGNFSQGSSYFDLLVVMKTVTPSAPGAAGNGRVTLAIVGVLNNTPVVPLVNESLAIQVNLSQSFASMGFSPYALLFDLPNAESVEFVDKRLGASGDYAFGSLQYSPLLQDYSSDVVFLARNSSAFYQFNYPPQTLVMNSLNPRTAMAVAHAKVTNGFSGFSPSWSTVLVNHDLLFRGQEGNLGEFSILPSTYRNWQTQSIPSSPETAFERTGIYFNATNPPSSFQLLLSGAGVPYSLSSDLGFHYNATQFTALFRKTVNPYSGEALNYSFSYKPPLLDLRSLGQRTDGVLLDNSRDSITVLLGNPAYSQLSQANLTYPNSTKISLNSFNDFMRFQQSTPQGYVSGAAFSIGCNSVSPNQLNNPNCQPGIYSLSWNANLFSVPYQNGLCLQATLNWTGAQFLLVQEQQGFLDRNGACNLNPPSIPATCSLSASPSRGLGEFNSTVTAVFSNLSFSQTSALISCNENDTGILVPVANGVAQRVCAFPQVTRYSVITASAGAGGANCSVQVADDARGASCQLFATPTQSVSAYQAVSMAVFDHLPPGVNTTLMKCSDSDNGTLVSIQFDKFLGINYSIRVCDIPQVELKTNFTLSASASNFSCSANTTALPRQVSCSINPASITDFGPSRAWYSVSFANLTAAQRAGNSSVRCSSNRNSPLSQWASFQIINDTSDVYCDYPQVETPVNYTVNVSVGNGYCLASFLNLPKSVSCNVVVEPAEGLGPKDVFVTAVFRNLSSVVNESRIKCSDTDRGAVVPVEQGVASRSCSYASSPTGGLKVINVTAGNTSCAGFFNLVPSCSDGTQLNACSDSKPLFCNSQGVLVANASGCGCPPGGVPASCTPKACPSSPELKGDYCVFDQPYCAIVPNTLEVNAQSNASVQVSYKDFGVPPSSFAVACGNGIGVTAVCSGGSEGVCTATCPYGLENGYPVIYYVSAASQGVLCANAPVKVLNPVSTTGSLLVRLTDCKYGTPLRNGNLTVFVNGTPYYPDSRGELTVQGLYPGQYLVRASRQGYFDANQVAFVTVGQTSRSDICLSTVCDFDAELVGGTYCPLTSANSTLQVKFTNLAQGSITINVTNSAIPFISNPISVTLASGEAKVIPLTLSLMPAVVGTHLAIVSAKTPLCTRNVEIPLCNLGGLTMDVDAQQKPAFAGERTCFYLTLRNYGPTQLPVAMTLNDLDASGFNPFFTDAFLYLHPNQIRSDSRFCIDVPQDAPLSVFRYALYASSDPNSDMESVRIAVARRPVVPTATPFPVPPYPTPTPTPGPGSVTGQLVVSTSCGASVFMEGEFQGVASPSVRITDLLPGSYHISISKQGYKPQSTIAYVIAGRDNFVNLACVPNPTPTPRPTATPTPTPRPTATPTPTPRPTSTPTPTPRPTVVPTPVPSFCEVSCLDPQVYGVCQQGSPCKTNAQFSSSTPGVSFAASMTKCNSGVDVDVSTSPFFGNETPQNSWLGAVRLKANGSSSVASANWNFCSPQGFCWSFDAGETVYWRLRDAANGKVKTTNCAPFSVQKKIATPTPTPRPTATPTPTPRPTAVPTPTPVPNSGLVVWTNYPANAYANKSYLGFANPVVYSMQMKPGLYLVIVNKSGFTGNKTLAELPPGKIVVVNLTIRPLPPVFGGLLVKSDNDPNVYVDDDYRGIAAPVLYLPNVTPGVYTVSAWKQGFYQSNVTTEVFGNRNTSINFTLMRVPTPTPIVTYVPTFVPTVLPTPTPTPLPPANSRLVIYVNESNAGAFVNGSLAGFVSQPSTPVYSQMLGAGRYLIIANKSGFTSNKTAVELLPNEIRVVRLSIRALPPVFGGFVVKSDNDPQILLDEDPVGIAAPILYIPNVVPGVYTVSAYKQGFYQSNVTTQVLPNRNTSINFTLMRVPTPTPIVTVTVKPTIVPTIVPTLKPAGGMVVWSNDNPSVFVDGIFAGTASPALFLSGLDPRTYSVLVNKTGYYKNSTSAIVQVNSVTLVNLSISKIPPATGGLTVVSTSGSSIYLNKQFVGTTGSSTALFVSNLLPGTYSISASKLGYYPANSTVQILSGKNSSIVFVLNKTPSPITGNAIVTLPTPTPKPTLTPTPVPTPTPTPVPKFPDLIVKTLSVKEKIPGTKLGLLIALANSGNSPSTSFDYRVSYDGKVVYSGVALALAPGESFLVDLGPQTGLNQSISEGVHTLVAEVDSLNKITEFSETNNKKTVKFGNAILPDLVIDGVQLPYRAEGTKLFAVINARNAGNSSSAAFNAVVSYDGKRVWTYRQGGLAPGQKVDLGVGPLNVTITKGTHTLYALLDYSNEIDEMSKKNNELSVEFGE